MDTIFIGIPILNRADLLRRCLTAIDHPAEVVVVNNSVDDAFRAELTEVGAGAGAQVLHQDRNRGVAGSWNLIARAGMARGFDRVFIGSNDTFLRAGSLRAAAAAAEGAGVGIWHLCAWNFFRIDRATIDRVGWFDENFYPAYKEDADYAYRCRLAGVRRVAVRDAGGLHVRSATIRSNPNYRRLSRRTHGVWNARYYRKKWGGNPRRERFRTPFNNPDRDHTWWPDPGGSIAARDWDRWGQK